MSLAEVQCHLDKEGASNLVIDLIMNATSDRVFHESILLAIALLEGGNTTIQVGGGVAAGEEPAMGGAETGVQKNSFLGHKLLLFCKLNSVASLLWSFSHYSDLVLIHGLHSEMAKTLRMCKRKRAGNLAHHR